MSKVRFELNMSGLNELMKSAEMQAILNDSAKRIAAAAGDGYEVEAAHPISFVAIAQVRPATIKARKSNLKHDTLLKALGSGKV